MSFLRNDAINRVNLHSGIQALAQGAGGVFVLVFLLRAGVSIPATLLVLAAIVTGRFILRPAVLPLALAWGLKPLLIIGTVGVALQYPLLAEVHGVDAALLALCVVSSVGDVFYWLAYHAYFATLGDAEHRGHQVGAREALVAVVGVVGPLLGAWALVTVGPRPAFAAVGLVQALAAVPLFGLPNVTIKQAAPGALRAAWPAMALIAVDGWFDSSFTFVWQIALFGSLGESLAGYGGAVALAGLVGAAGGLLLGRHVDRGYGRRSVVIAYAVATVVVLVRASSLASPWLAVAANALGALVIPLLIPVLATVTYNLAKASPCPFRFSMATEGSWDVGCLAGCLCAAGIAASGASLSFAILLALPGIAAGKFLLWRHYSRGIAGTRIGLAEEAEAR